MELSLTHSFNIQKLVSIGEDSTSKLKQTYRLSQRKCNVVI
ncbi:unnamed protein product [Acanthoscelides obtectus]|uniref:Uncharacterized protein n=1 Tax=Acanthoscelides obtectus TaxID=200917 RepID=A0A9P0LVV1_ACAOB|nr:unnamed protein product [Acanthoscelides obtectus]CAK1627653.1 hypothetical protein AOBTE_LOCUS4734 [Acanthoscelides obtectus]